MTYPKPSFLKPCKDLINSSRINVYKDSKFKTRGTCSPSKSYNAYIGKNHICYIYEMTSSSFLVEFPTSSGRRSGYIRRSDVTSASSPESCKAGSTNWASSRQATTTAPTTRPSPSVKAGDKVRTGDKIGRESWQGISSKSSSHTHVEVSRVKKEYAAKSVGDSRLENDNPSSFWKSLGYSIK